MLMLKLVALLAFVLLASSVGRADEPPANAVLNPHVRTDKSIDCSTVDRILAGLVTKDMTDEEKVLACFNWVRRVIYHGDGPKELAYDFHKMVNVLGHGSCLRQTTPLAMLLGKLGYESQSWTHDGHHMMQVKYGGAWHCLDPHMTFYVYDRSTPRRIASIEQLQEDPTLAIDAVKEGRAAPGYLLCGDQPAFFAGKGGTWINEGRFPKLKIDEPFGRIALRRGETCTRTWMPSGPWFHAGSWRKDSGPFHTCCRQDRKDAVNWPLYEPHVARIGEFITYRHWGVGLLVFAPDLRTDHYLDAVVSQANIKHLAPHGIVQDDATKPGEVVFSVQCPYVVTGAKVGIFSATGRVTIAVSADGGKTWMPMKLDLLEEAAYTGALKAPVNGSFAGYQLRLSLADGARVNALRIETAFQLNPYSLPYLVPGRNVVTVEADRFGSPLTLEWRYAEGPDWDKAEPKAAKQTFTKSGEMAVEVGGDKWPRNLSLTLSVAP